MFAWNPTYEEHTAQLIKIVSPPPRAPVTLQEARDQLRIFHQEQDGMISRLIYMATEAAERFTQRAIITRTIEAYLPRFLPIIYLRYPPLLSVEKIEYLDPQGVNQELDQSIYFVEDNAAPASIQLMPGEFWPGTAEHPHAVTISYTAGYGDEPIDVPEDLRGAILAVVNALYDNPSSIDPRGNQNEMQDIYRAIFSPYTMHVT